MYEKMHEIMNGTPKLTLKEVERRHIRAVLEEEGGNISKAAQVLGIARGTLHRKLKSYGFEVRIVVSGAPQGEKP